MKIHEFQAKEIMSNHGIKIPAQFLANSPTEAKEAALTFPDGCVIKAQVHSGGRGKASGVVICNSPDEAYKAAEKLIGSRLYTKQAGSDGLYVPAVLVTEKIEIKKELYFAIAIDNAKLEYIVIASQCGGMDIEDAAKEFPEKIVRVSVPCGDPIRQFQIQYLADKLELDKKQTEQLKAILEFGLLYAIEKDASLVEINPLAIVGEDLVAADAKITFDDNALYRHPDIKVLEDLTQINPLEQEARSIGLAYVKLNGNIACLVNGAGLAMATMDIIKSYGGDPADFMDVGGGVGVEKVTAAFKLIMKDKSTKSIFVNIFGGIAQCDVIAEGIVQATKQTGLSIPLIVRLRGTHEEEGRRILDNSGLSIYSITDFTEAAQKAIELARGGNA